MKISWMVSPVTLVPPNPPPMQSNFIQLFAQKYLPPQAWGNYSRSWIQLILVPFFNLVGFVLGTYINTQTKRRRRLAALKKQVPAPT